jgi:hypothetical protein
MEASTSIWTQIWVTNYTTTSSEKNEGILLLKCYGICLNMTPLLLFVAALQHYENSLFIYNIGNFQTVLAHRQKGKEQSILEKLVNFWEEERPHIFRGSYVAICESKLRFKLPFDSTCLFKTCNKGI